ncbi:MAG: hypothetical protein KF686_09225 [Ramlibacter sp.]|nr:hypothetical protein [Ramlibacter sp.]
MDSLVAGFGQLDGQAQPMSRDSTLERRRGVPTRKGIHWAIDNLVVNEFSLVCHGWVFSDLGLIRTVSLRLTNEENREEVVPLRYGLLRPDVVEANPGTPTACGFFFHGGIQLNLMTKAQLVISIEAPECQESAAWTYALDLPRKQETTQIAPATMANLLLLRHQAERAAKMLIRGQWGSLWSAMRRRLNPLKAPKASPTDLELLLGDLSDEACVFIDHSLGGGANRFRHEQIDSHLASGRDAILWTFAPAILQFQIIRYRRAEAPKEFRVAWSALELVLKNERIGTVFVNNCVSFPQPERVPSVLLEALKARNFRLIMYLHDFHWVCPSHFLLDKDRRFCGVPTISRCRDCLPAIQDQLASLYLPKDIDGWRAQWAPLLAVATEVRCFSQSAKSLLVRAYPQLNLNAITVVPHHVARLPGRFIYPLQGSGICVAVVGSIGTAKGSHVVEALSSLLTGTTEEFRLVVIGELQADVPDGGVVQTGAYKPERLAELLVANGVHIALMPSVVAETFSYVTHELIQLGVPVLCFSLGAQAEAVCQYPLGKVVPLETTTVELLAQLVAFKSELDDRFKATV